MGISQLNQQKECSYCYSPDVEPIGRITNGTINLCHTCDRLFVIIVDDKGTVKGT